MKPVRILHLHGSFDLGGKEARAVKLINHFGDEARHSILSADRSALGALDAIDSGIDARFPDDAPSLAGRPSILRYRALASYMKAFDLVLGYNWGAMDGVMAHSVFSKSMGLPPLIHHEDGFNADEAERLKKRRNMFRIVALARTDALVVPSQTLETIARKTWNQPQEKVHRIVNGIDIERYAKKPQRGAIPGFKPRGGEVVVGTLAGLRPVKALPRLVRAVAKAGDRIRLVIVGEGPERAAIEAEAKRCGIADRVLLPGFLSDPHRYVGLFDIFALSSDSEQFPISLVEAMAAGVPVAAPDVGDVMQMVSAANRPYIVPAADEEALTEAIAKLAGDGKLLDKIGESNRARAAAEFNDAKMFARYRLLYGSALNRADFAGQRL